MALIVHRKSPALTRLITLYARARNGAIRTCDGPTGAAPILFHLFAGGGADRPARIELDQVDRPLPSYGVSFDNTPFAAALRLGC